jgi:hypothetical protein
MQRDLLLANFQSIEDGTHPHTSPDLENELCGVWIWIPLPRANAEIEKSPNYTQESIGLKAKV